MNGQKRTKVVQTVMHRTFFTVWDKPSYQYLKSSGHGRLMSHLEDFEIRTFYVLVPFTVQKFVHDFLKMAYFCATLSLSYNLNCNKLGIVLKLLICRVIKKVSDAG